MFENPAHSNFRRSCNRNIYLLASNIHITEYVWRERPREHEGRQ